MSRKTQTNDKFTIREKSNVLDRQFKSHRSTIMCMLECNFDFSAKTITLKIRLYIRNCRQALLLNRGMYLGAFGIDLYTHTTMSINVIIFLWHIGMLKEF